MSRGYTPRHAQTAGDLSFAVQFNDETLWHFPHDPVRQSHERRNDGAR